MPVRVRDDTTLAQVLKAYRKLDHSELVLFLKVRNLPSSGSDEELASRLAHHDLHTYHFHSQFVTPPPSPPTLSISPPKQAHKPRQHATPDLPVELLACIIDHVGDWELARAVGLPTSLPEPREWSQASNTDWAILGGSLKHICAINLCVKPPSQLGAIAAVRFGYVHVLDYFLQHHPLVFKSIFRNYIIPIKASRHGRINVLSWWRKGFEQVPDLIPPPLPHAISECIDGASRNGQVASLDWWLDSGLPLEYTEATLEYASARGQIAVLEWWKYQNTNRGLPLKIGRVMDMASTAGQVDILEWWAASQLEFKYDRHALQSASCHGRVEVLQWWLGSGLQLMFDQEALTGATRYNRPEVLEWWDKSGLPIQYRMCDIEEALEDAMGGGEAVRAWWKKKGIDFNANHNEWTKLQSLN
ncbi:hypothetical protein AX16_003985 [Volvariella volvacea WC 439]|nr:hypothetical protein AX16_003985 [Volvariella volvacea WC 439]